MSETKKTTAAKKQAAVKKPVAATKSAVGKKPATAKKPAAAKKPVAAKKTAAAKKPATPRTRKKPVQPVALSTEAIRISAYYLAERDGFRASPVDYWLSAENTLRSAS